MWIWQKKNVKEKTVKQNFGNLWIHLTSHCISQPLFWHISRHSLSWYPQLCPSSWSSSWSNTLEHCLLSPGCFLDILWALVSPEDFPESSHLVSCSSSEAPPLTVLLTIVMFCLCIIMVCLCICISPAQNGSFAKLESMSSSWLNLQAWGMLNKSTNNWIHIPLPWVIFNWGNQRTNNTHWLHWFFLKLLHPQLKDGPCLPHLLRTMYISPCSHGFIHVFAKGKCSSWVGHLVMGLPAEQGRWHHALHPLYTVGGELLCLLVTSSLTHNLIFSKCKVPTATLKDILSDIQFNN